MATRTFDKMTPEERSELGRKGGERTSQDQEHMKRIGRMGGSSLKGKKRNALKRLEFESVAVEFKRVKTLLNVTYSALSVQIGLSVPVLENLGRKIPVGDANMKLVIRWIEKFKHIKTCSACDGKGYELGGTP